MIDNFDSNTKFSDIFKNLNGLDLNINDMELPVSVYNDLKRNKIENLQQLLLKCENDLSKRSCAYIIEWLRELSKRT